MVALLMIVCIVCHSTTARITKKKGQCSARIKRAKKANVGSLVLDRNGLLYHGRVKAFTESARKHGLEL